MPGVLGSDDLGWLILVLSSFKCLNLNSIMSGVLGPDDLGWLTLVLSSFKYLNLNQIMHGVLGPNDFGWLTRSQFFEVFKLKFNHAWSSRTR